MKSARCKAFVVLLVLLVGAPVPVHAQYSILVRPQFEESLTAPRGLYPHKSIKRPRIALVLSGGGARGVSQIGVLRVLERHNVPVDFIVATSLGAVVGGLYASGYTSDEIEKIALTTNWDEVLSLSDESKRTDLFIDQKLADDRSFLAVRFQGLEPVIPPAVSSGQRLTDFLSTQTLQALYHPDPHFDDLKIPFRAISTDLISGRRIVMMEGSLAEALRASATVPLLFNPVDRDSMQLIDGGLVSNIPVDVARAEDVDIVLVVNSTSGLRNRVELKAPWQTADQIMGIMMQSANEQQLAQADIVITPDVGKHLSSDFRNLDVLIAKGEQAAEEMMEAILALYERRFREGMASEYVSVSVADHPDHPSSIDTSGFRHGGDWWSDTLSIALVEGNDTIVDSLLGGFRSLARERPVTLRELARHLKTLYATGAFSDVYAEVCKNEEQCSVRVIGVPSPILNQVVIEGCRLIPEITVVAEFPGMMHKPFNPPAVNNALERVLRLYREKGYSLARIDSTSFDPVAGVLYVALNEGRIGRIDVQGGVRTQDYYLLREFPLEEGDVFDIEKARRGLVNIGSTKLYEYVYLEVSYPDNQPLLTIRLKERPSQLVRLGVRVDNERNFQGYIDIRDENFHGTGAQLGFTFAGGNRNREVALEYKALRLLESYLTFNIGAFHSLYDTYVYADAPVASKYRWERQRLGEYRDIRYGGRLVFGSQLERLGNATIEMNVQQARIRNVENMEELEERFLLSLIRFGTMIDTKDSYPFPRSGIGLNVLYEISSRRLGSDVGYNSLKVMYESYSSWGAHTIHPRVVLGFADRTTPLGQQFRLGGRESFFGVNEDDRRGRQLLLVNLEYRLLLPIRFAFDAYARLRYDIGLISAIPEEIKIRSFRHGIGAELALDTPVGPAMVGVGKGFQFVRDLPQNPIQQGPFLLYFLIGYQF